MQTGADFETSVGADLPPKRNRRGYLESISSVRLFGMKAMTSEVMAFLQCGKENRGTSTW